MKRSRRRSVGCCRQSIEIQHPGVDSPRSAVSRLPIVHEHLNLVTVRVVDIERAKEEGALRCSRRCHRGVAARWTMSSAPAKCFSVDRHHHAGPPLIHLMKTEEPIDVIAGLKPARAGVETPHRRLQTDAVGAAEGRRRNAFALTMSLSCTGVTSTLPVSSPRTSSPASSRCLTAGPQRHRRLAGGQQGGGRTSIA